MKFNDLQIQKDTIQQQVDSGTLEKKVLQSHLMVCQLNQVSVCCKYDKEILKCCMLWFISLQESNANAEREKTEIEKLESEKQQLQ